MSNPESIDPETINLTINSVGYTVSVLPEMPLLWVLRDELGLTGTKYGCGIGNCGACTVLINGSPVRSCVTSVGSVSRDSTIKITTIEGLVSGNSQRVDLLSSWVEHQVAQCGYCQPGQIVSATALLERTRSPDVEDINVALAGNLCRCGTYTRIHAAINAIASQPPHFEPSCEPEFDQKQP